MEINVKLGEPLWRAAGKRRLTLHWDEGQSVTVGAVLARLASEYPNFTPAFAGHGLVQAYPYRVFVDAVLVQPAVSGPATPSKADYPTPLHDGQTVFILLPAAGG